ncbi:MAG TPA: 1,4-dihydroxy-6-naphthoate synthase [Bacteroidales bacterium]|nr:1,4-dihydroxy-6-naphthoate synthase [Bacteroidales bacterium]
MPALSLAISPCPNDTLMFDALVNSKIASGEISFNTEYHDIEQLNNGLMSGKWEVAKMSAAAFPLVMKDYVMLQTGMAMGFGNGPLIVAKNAEIDLNSFKDTMLIPGIHTTANLLLTKFFSNITNKNEVLFSDILPLLEAGKAAAGLIIHESRFTYPQYGLHKIADMGELWFHQTKIPLPLGVIVARRSLGFELIRKLEMLLQESVIYGLQHRDDAMSYIRSHAQETDDDVINHHIDLYVNQFSSEPGQDGLQAVLTLLQSLPENHSLSLHDIFSPWVN